MGQLEEALSYLDKAGVIFELLQDNNYLPMLKEGREKLLHLIEKQKETDRAL